MSRETSDIEPGGVTSSIDVEELQAQLADNNELDERGLEYLSRLNKLHDVFVSVIDALKEKIEKGSISTIIADDTGGRIPALLLNRIINRYNQAHDLPQVNILFVQSQRAKQIEQVDTSGDSRQLRNAQDPVLVVTEFIDKGDRLSVLLKRLAEQRLHEVLVVAIAVARDFSSGDMVAGYRDGIEVDERLGEVPLLVGSTMTRDIENSLAAFEYDEAKAVYQEYIYSEEGKEPDVNLNKKTPGLVIKSTRNAMNVFAGKLYHEIFEEKK